MSLASSLRRLCNRRSDRAVIVTCSLASRRRRSVFVGGRRPFGGVLKGVSEKISDMAVSERVVHVLGDATALDHPLGPQKAQLLRDRRKRNARRLRKLSDAPLSAVGEPRQQLQSGYVTGGAKEAGSALVSLFAHARADRRPHIVLGRLARGKARRSAAVRHATGLHVVGPRSGDPQRRTESPASICSYVNCTTDEVTSVRRYAPGANIAKLSQHDVSWTFR